MRCYNIGCSTHTHNSGWAFDPSNCRTAHGRDAWRNEPAWVKKHVSLPGCRAVLHCGALLLAAWLVTVQAK